MVSIQDVVSELADNWPAFVYIALMLGFSVVFLRERRGEVRVLKEMGAALEERMRIRFDHLEYLVEHSRKASTPAESQQHPTRET
jgi:hypothetical protein